MAVLKLLTTPYRRKRLRTRGKRADGGVVAPTKVIFVAKDYNGMSADEWKAAIQKDVAERFGPLPEDLFSTSEAGW